MKYAKILLVLTLPLVLGFQTQALAKEGGRNFLKEAVEYRLKGYKAGQNRYYDEAIQYLQKACALDPYYAAPHNDLGVIYEIKGWFEKAEQEYLKALSIDQNFAESVMNLALHYESRGLMARAIPYFKKRIELGPPDSPWVKLAKESLAKYSPAAYKEAILKEEASQLLQEAKSKQKESPLKFMSKGVYKDKGSGVSDREIKQRTRHYKKLEQDLSNPELEDWFLGMSKRMAEMVYGPPDEKKVISRRLLARKREKWIYRNLEDNVVIMLYFDYESMVNWRIERLK